MHDIGFFFFFSFFAIKCRGPAPADPGYSRRDGVGDLFKC